ncbi:hypothetical protein [Saccharothrix sp. ST-888]|uniref:hypothetical protein n=1 Tax=Saccharothrix sp. ST-888 TaxID=1427391 RepID=UPI000B215346|nr:hypothetical protein [Saccharothrix sp. ST-888]
MNVRQIEALWALLLCGAALGAWWLLQSARQGLPKQGLPKQGLPKQGLPGQGLR